MATVTKDSTALTRYTGFVSPPYKVILHGDDGAVLNLTGVSAGNIEIFLVNGSGPEAFKGSGSFTITDAVNGKVSYQWDKADLLTNGTFFAWITVQMPGEPSRRAFDPDIILIHPFAGGLLVAEQDVNISQINGVAVSSSNPLPVSGPVTTIDGGQATIGAQTDSAYSGSGAASVVAILKGMFSQLKSTVSRSMIAPWGSNPSQTATSAADTQYKFGASGNTPVLGILLQNNTGAVVNYAIDLTASGNTFTLQDKAGIFIDVGAPINILHLSTAAQQYVNSPANPGIFFEAWG